MCLLATNPFGWRTDLPYWHDSYHFFLCCWPGSEPGTARAIIRARDLGRTLQRTVRFTRTAAEELDSPLQHAIPATGISDVAQVVFVRKRLVEIQYLRTTITDERRHEFGHWLKTRSAESNPPNFCRTANSIPTEPL
jgi:hypothetical protein